jgi:hypothetical protein
VALCAPPPPAPAGAAQVFSRVCASADLASCVPPCDASVSGFMLHIEIDGQGTTMTCNRYDGTFSWQGLASLGGYVQTDGADNGAFFLAVVSGAAGVCVIHSLTLPSRVPAFLSSFVLICWHLRDQPFNKRWHVCLSFERSTV